MGLYCPPTLVNVKNRTMDIPVVIIYAKRSTWQGLCELKREERPVVS